MEIGGVVPFADVIPAVWHPDSLFPAQIPWIYQLVKCLPRLTIEQHKVQNKGAGVYEVEIWIRNEAKLPFPTAMGKRNKKPAPAVITVSGKNLDFLSGRSSTPLTGLDGYTNRKLTWIIRTDKPEEINITVNAPNAFGDSKTIKPEGR